MVASRMFWALALGSLLVVAAVAVPAAGLLGMGHPHNGTPAAGQANRHPPGWGAPGPSYAVTFQESGLPLGTVWAVTVVPVWSHAPPSPGPLGAAAPAWQGGPTNRSTNASLGFDLINGTYHYTIPDVVAGDELFSASPASGNLTINGSGTSVGVAFSHAPLYDLSFTETGLPSGAFWSVALNGSGFGVGPGAPGDGGFVPFCQNGSYNGSTTDVVSFEVPNGTYGFSVGNVSSSGALYAASPANGSVTVDGANVSVAITFTAIPLFDLSFTESGLPSGTFWSVAVSNASSGGFWNGSTSGTVAFLVPAGVYNFTVNNVTNCTGVLYVPTPANGTVAVDDANASVAVTFAPVPVYSLSFTETGLPSGTFWSVAVSNASSGGFWNGSTSGTVAFLVPAGVYNFTVNNVTNCTGVLYVPTPANGTVAVDDANASVAVAFAPEAVYTLSFTESGLPAGANWSVALFGLAGPGGWNGSGVAPLCGGFGEYNSSSNATLNFTVPNGTYAFYVGNVSVGTSLYVPSPMSGNATVNGTAVDVPVDFARVSLYQLSFVESGLANGTFWSVGVNSSATGWAWNGSDGTTVNFTLPNGTYNFSVGNASTCMGGLFTPVPSNGTVTIAGANLSVDIAFHAVALVSVTIVESGLPNGTGWFAILAGEGYSVSFAASNGTSLTLSVPNGTYVLHLPDVWAGGTLYEATPSCEVVTVSGSAVTISVSFAPA